MRQAKSLVKGVTILLCLGIGLFWMTTADSANNKTTYELDAGGVVESYYGDASRMIAAYEQLSTQYLNLVQNQLNRTSDDIQRGGQKLEAIEKKLDALALRLGRIEKALKIADEVKPAPRTDSPADKPVGAELHPPVKTP